MTHTYVTNADLKRFTEQNCIQTHVFYFTYESTTYFVFISVCVILDFLRHRRQVVNTSSERQKQSGVNEIVHALGYILIHDNVVPVA